MKAFARTDEAIEREIREDVLSHTLWLRDPDAITVAVEHGTVKLKGMVDNPADAELVEVFARRVPGVVDVESSLTWLGQNGTPG